MTYKELRSYFRDELEKQFTISESDLLFEIIVQHSRKWDQFALRKNMEKEIEKKEETIYRTIIAELKTGKPYQQILGETEFYGLRFFVDQHVLIPRPETEELLELATIKIKEAHFKRNFKILDIGTGSGIIPIVLKRNFPEAEVSGIDISPEALHIAKRNALLHETEINFKQQNYLEEQLIDIYDVIISNPPYIGREEVNEIEASVKDFEPKIALFSPTENALIFYEKIAKDCVNHLAEDGMVFLEINQKLGNDTLNLFREVLSESYLVKDMSGNDRFVWGRR